MACTPSLPEFVERQLRMRQAFGIIKHILRPVAPTDPPAHNFNSVDEIPITAAIKDALKNAGARFKTHSRIHHAVHLSSSSSGSHRRQSGKCVEIRPHASRTRRSRRAR